MRKLQKIYLKDGDILSMREMKLVVGGSGAHYEVGTCGAYVPNSANNGYGSLAGSGASFHAESLEVNLEANIYRGVSKDFALAITQGVSGGKWCCDNCSEASWY